MDFLAGGDKKWTGISGRLERYCADPGGSPGIFAPLAMLLVRGFGSAADGAAFMPEDPMAKSKSRKPDTSQHARPKSKHGKSRDSGSRKTTSCKVTRPRTTTSTAVTIRRKSQSGTKQAQVIAMLRAPSGATIDAMMQKTGWQQHSVRGFLAAVIRKKLGLDLQSEATERGRVYRLNDRATSNSVDSKAKQAA